MTSVSTNEGVLSKASLEREQGSGRIPELDGLRGLAIILVISRHFGLAYLFQGTESEWVHFFNLFYPTLKGVDLFFVLSGFLLGTSLLASLDRPRYYSSFYRKRYFRTFPPYYLLLAVFIAAMFLQELLGVYLTAGLSWPFSTPWSLAAYGVFLQNFWMAYEGSLGPRGLEITWSLALQEQFYLLLPLLLRWTPRRFLIPVLTGLILLAPLGRFLLVYFDTSAMHHRYDCLLPFRMDTLGAGVLVAALLRNAQIKSFLIRYRSCLTPVGLLLLGGFASLTDYGFGLGTQTMFVAGYAYLAVLYSVLVLIAVLCSRSVVSWVLRVGWLRELGLISYGLFLYHQVVNMIVHGLLFGSSPGTGEWEAVLATVDALLITIILAEVSWHYLEQPLMRWGRPSADVLVGCVKRSSDVLPGSAVRPHSA